MTTGLGERLLEQERAFRDMLVVTHRLPSSKNTTRRNPGQFDMTYASTVEYRRQLGAVGLTVVPDALRNSMDDLYAKGRSREDPLPYPPEIYGRHPGLFNRKSDSLAVTYPEGWQSIVPEDDHQRFQIVDSAGETAVAVFARVNDTSNNGYPTFRVAIRGFDESLIV